MSARGRQAQYARVKLSIWTDPDFAALPGDARFLYLFLLSNPKASRVGVADYVPAKWGRMLGMDPERLERALASLVAARFVFYDEDTAEVAVRTRVKHDPAGSPLQIKGVWRAWERIESQQLAQQLLHELPEDLWTKAPEDIHTPEMPSDQDVATVGPCVGPTVGPGDGPRVPRMGAGIPQPQPEPAAAAADTFDRAVEEVIDRRGARAAAETKNNPSGWLAAARAGIARELREHDDYGRLVYDGASPDAFADLIEAKPRAALPPSNPHDGCVDCGGTRWVEDDHGTAHPCEAGPRHLKAVTS